MLEVVEAKRDSYKKQIQILKNSHNDEILRRDQLTEKYQETIKNLEKEFKDREKQLTEAQKDDIKEVFVESKGDHDEIKKRIEQEFGIKYAE